MGQMLRLTYFKPEKQGVYRTANGYSFAEEVPDQSESGVILYDKKGEPTRIPFSDKGKRGSLYGVVLESANDQPFLYVAYNYFRGDLEYTDPLAKKIEGLKTFGGGSQGKRLTRGSLVSSTFDWGGDEPLCIPYEDTIVYGLNVRSFTMHGSAGVKHRGTFEGVAEKVLYFKELGITAVELMPAYEYDECLYPVNGPFTKGNRLDEDICENADFRVNCWGYQEGFYFAPKASYSAADPEISFQSMVKTLHANGIEVWMQFYFVPGMQPSRILDILKFWVIHYHVDGFRLCGFELPFALIARDPVLKETKLRSTYFPVEEIYGDPSVRPVYRNLAVTNGSFRTDMRRFLKGDENLVNAFLTLHRQNPAVYATINEIADYDGFSLMDLVSYDRKHNEANGENNRDGTDRNFSWNCGMEGESRKRQITELRKRQIKNALTFLFLSQGVPYLFAGDEFGNTRHGNNNAYCQDNETGYVKWKKTKFGMEILDFTKHLIALRKTHAVFHQQNELKVLDYKSVGYPDISYHGAEAWRPDVSYVSRTIGMMLCGSYLEPADRSFYLGINMHWIDHKLALPKLPKGQMWVPVFSTFAENPQKKAAACDCAETTVDEQPENVIAAIPGRSCMLYMSSNVHTEPVDIQKRKTDRNDGKQRKQK